MEMRIQIWILREAFYSEVNRDDGGLSEKVFGSDLFGTRRAASRVR
jgi:hypothetical protein